MLLIKKGDINGARLHFSKGLRLEPNSKFAYDSREYLKQIGPLTMVENFGSYLRNERELRGIPLEEIADSTKINMRFLQALESNDYEKLPAGEVFIKGYIRSYAKTIGTNVDEILAIVPITEGSPLKVVRAPTHIIVF